MGLWCLCVGISSKSVSAPMSGLGYGVSYPGQASLPRSLGMPQAQMHGLPFGLFSGQPVLLVFVCFSVCVLSCRVCVCVCVCARACVLRCLFFVFVCFHASLVFLRSSWFFSPSILHVSYATFLPQLFSFLACLCRACCRPAATSLLHSIFPVGLSVSQGLLRWAGAAWQHGHGWAKQA